MKVFQVYIIFQEVAGHCLQFKLPLIPRKLWDTSIDLMEALTSLDGSGLWKFPWKRKMMLQRKETEASTKPSKAFVEVLRTIRGSFLYFRESFSLWKQLPPKECAIPWKRWMLPWKLPSKLPSISMEAFTAFTAIRAASTKASMCFSGMDKASV